MSIKLTKRVAAQLLGRGESSVRIKGTALQDAEKAITREDVRALIKKGDVFAMPEKHNMSVYSKELSEKRAEGRKRGMGRRKGTTKARRSVEHKKRVRGQRRVLAALKNDKTINNELYKEFYRLVRGGTFQSKAQLISHMKGHGVNLSEERMKELKHM